MVRRALTRGHGGLTLVELLVAVSLSTILILIITFVWTQSSRIVSETVERLEVYQNLRSVLDAVERDLANASRTVDMEFWKDANGNGRFDDGEELKLPDGTFFRAPRDKSDPLVRASQKEFADDKLNDVKFFAAPTISSPAPYTIDRSGRKEAHWRDEVFVRSFAMVGGINRSALVHYRLTGTDKGRAQLRRRVWYLDKDGQVAFKQDQPELSTDRTSVLADSILDLKVGFLFKENPLEGKSVLYHVRPDGNLSGETSEIVQFVDQDRLRFEPALGTLKDKSVSPLKKAKSLGGGVNALTFMYEGWGRFEYSEERGVQFRPIARGLDEVPVQGATPDYKAGSSGFDFPGVRKGDRVYVFDALDDDNDDEPAEKAKREALRPQYFPDRYLTVLDIPSESARPAPAFNKDPAGPKAISLVFAEVIDYYRLKDWVYREKTVRVEPTSSDSLVVVPRTISMSFEAKYRIGFLPSAFVVRLTYDDRRHQRVIPFERVIRLLNQ